MEKNVKHYKDEFSVFLHSVKFCYYKISDRLLKIVLLHNFNICGMF